MTQHFSIDFETGGVRAEHICFSAGIVHFEMDSIKTFSETVAGAKLFRFNVDEQYALGRRYFKSTMDWWAKQSREAQLFSLPHPKQVVPGALIDTLNEIKDYIAKHNPNKEQIRVWSRGTFDGMMLDSLCENVNMPPIVRYNQYRELRTALDLLYGTDKVIVKSEFMDMEYIGHNPMHDAAFNVMQLLHGEENE